MTHMEIESGDMTHLLDALAAAEAMARWSQTALLSTPADRRLAQLRLDAYTRIRAAADSSPASPLAAFVCGTCGWEASTPGEEAANLAHAAARPACPGSPQEDWENAK